MIDKDFRCPCKPLLVIGHWSLIVAVVFLLSACSPAIGQTSQSADAAASLGLWDKLAQSLDRMMPKTAAEAIWLITGLLGEFVFFLRFVVQWVVSERRRQTVVPMSFWYLSLVGTVMVLAYAFYRMDAVFILAYSLNIVIYVRNLMIARTHALSSAQMTSAK